MDVRELHGTVSHDDGLTLTLTRDVAIPVEELWSWITDSDRTARWYGPWSGEGRVGATIQVTMASEEGSPTMRMRITECSRPHRLGLASDAPPPFGAPEEVGEWPWEEAGLCAAMSVLELLGGRSEVRSWTS